MESESGPHNSATQVEIDGWISTGSLVWFYGGQMMPSVGTNLH